MYFKVLQTNFWRKRVPGVPTKAQQSGFGGERRHSEATELLPSKGQNEGYEACADAIRRRICAVLPYIYGISAPKTGFPCGTDQGISEDTSETFSERLLRRKKDVSAKQDSSRQNHAEKAARFCVRTHKRRLPNVFRDAKKTSSETSRKTPLRPEKTLLQDKT